MFRSLFLTLVLFSVFTNAQNASSGLSPVTISLWPAKPLIEHRGNQQLLNFDFLLENHGNKPLHLNRIQLSALDSAGRLEFRRELDENGRPSGMTTIENRELKASDRLGIFNPFYSFGPEIQLSKLVYTFYFNEPGYQTATPLDWQYSAEISIVPMDYPGKTRLMLPVHGSTIIFDGHDFYAHHRRHDPTDPMLEKLGMKGNSTRYSYDFCPVNEKGEMYKDSPYKKENWYGYGAAIYATADGTISAAVNDVPENDFKGKKVSYAEIPETKLRELVGGNYVVIDHGNGEFSYYAHMQPGSVLVKTGNRVRQGQQIGKLGFAGDAFIPHLHYQLMDNADVFRAEGLPSYFVRFRRILGSKSEAVDRGQIDTGDIVEIEKDRVVIK